MNIKQQFSLASLGLAAALCIPAPSHAATFNEVGDAGQTLLTANLVTSLDPTSISGVISAPSDADLFAVMLTAGSTFTARSAAGSSGPAIADTQLFLFDPGGKGLRYNDDVEVTDFYSQVSFTPGASGTYYLGISAVAFNPQDASSAFIYVRDPFNPTAQPGPSAAGPLASWAADGSGFEDMGAYSIEVSGVSPIPEPGTYASMALGLVMLAALRRRFPANKTR